LREEKEEEDLKETFQLHKIRMNDGGYCNIFIFLNLTTHKIEVLNIAGDA